jgi:hypothetical protein
MKNDHKLNNQLTIGGPMSIPMPPKNMVTPKIRFKFSLPKRARGTRAINQKVIYRYSGTDLL